MTSVTQPAAPGETQRAQGTQPSDQENEDPITLKDMFVDGMNKIGTHRTENLFEALEKRTLTTEEQAVIDERVAHQRRMFEQFERRERARKIIELQELCPDITAEEAQRALDLCDGREEEAASALISDPAFKRRIQAMHQHQSASATFAVGSLRQPGSRRSQKTNNRSNGPRPKLVDPAALGDSVFVGVFRGKGFQNASAKPRALRRAHLVHSKVKESEDERSDGDADANVEGDGPSEEQEQHQNSEGEKRDAMSSPLLDVSREVVAAPLHERADPVSRQIRPVEAKMAIQLGLTPSSEPRAWALVKEASEGDLCLVSDSDLVRVNKKVVACLHEAEAVIGEAEEGEEEEEDDGDMEGRERGAISIVQLQGPAHAAGRRLPRVPAATDPEDLSTSTLESIASRLMDMEDNDAIAWLSKMAASVAAAGLATLGEDDPERAVVLRELLDAQEEQQKMQEEARTAVGTHTDGAMHKTVRNEQEDAEQGHVAAIQAPPLRRSPRSAAIDVAPSPATATTAPAAESMEGIKMANAPGEEASKDVNGPKQKGTTSGCESPLTKTKTPSSLKEEEEADDDEETETESEGFVTGPIPNGRGEAGQAAAAGVSVGIRAGRPQRAAKSAALARKLRESALPDDDDIHSSDDESTESESEGRRRAGHQPSKRRKSDAGAKGLDGAQQGQRQHSTTMDVDGTGHEGGAGPRPSIQECEEAGGRVMMPPLYPSAAAVNSRAAAISSRGHTNRGRVKQKSHKSAELVEAGTLRAEKGWYNAGYIFPEGFKSRTLFRSSVALDQLCVHECYIIGRGGQHWPAPTYKVVALDRPDEPLIAKSCTGCWSAVLRRINAEIEARRRAGEDLPPPPKTAIAGPEYFGLNQPNIVLAIEALDPEGKCIDYWAGKRDRELAAAGLPAVKGGAGASGSGSRPLKAPRRPAGSGGRRRRGSNGRGNGSDSDGSLDEEGADDEGQYTTSRWSAINRAERYRKRLEESGENPAELAKLDEDNPLPDFMDPITLEPVIRPAISPFGHVMGAATWKAVLAESNGVCPFTKQPLKWEQCRMLTKHNIDAFKDQIIR